MQCRYCLGERVVWRNQGRPTAYTYCEECRRRNCEKAVKALPHGFNECARAQLPLKMS
jgi:hypothetical protein